jgi:Peptidase family M1 domain
MSRARLAGLAAAATLVLTGCTSFADTVTRPTPDAAPATASPSDAPARACPTERARPDPHRPVVDLNFRLEDDRSTVTGTEKVDFTPDRRVSELVFRLVPNGPDSAPDGNRLVVDAVRGNDVAQGGYQSAAAADPGGLYVVTLTHALPPGKSTTVELDFTLTLGAGDFDRFGTDQGVSWWASGAPLLAWEPGVGWAEDPFVALSGETATSPVMDTSVSVSAPADLTVLMTGTRAEPSVAQDGRRTWTSTEKVARDVGVAAGLFTTAQATADDGVGVTVGVLPGAERAAPELAQQTADAITGLAAHVGPFPYRTLTVALLPDHGGGIEYPSMIFEASPDPQVLVHEVAHMWFYGMVGNSQFRDPWLDEAFASWAETVVDGGHGLVDRRALSLDGPVGGSMADYQNDRDYFALVYDKGGAALLAARDAAGPDAFDAAIRCYVDANAWSIATPDDVGAALADLPAALTPLMRAGALDKKDVPR